MKKVVIVLSILLFLSACAHEPFVVSSDVKAIKVSKGDNIIIPYDGYLVSDYVIYRLLMEEERKE